MDITLLPKFNIVLDKRLKDGTCAYKVVYQHEQDHKDVYEKYLSENMENIKKAVIEATKSVKPVYVKNLDSSHDIEMDFGKKLENHDAVENIRKRK